MSDIQAQENADMATHSRLRWDIGTAYDLFISLAVLHNPDGHGLRASWAAGVRSRLPAADRRFLEEVHSFSFPPFHWIYSLAEPKDAITALYTLRQIPVEERMRRLLIYPDMDQEVIELLLNVAQTRQWEQKEFEALRSHFRKREHKYSPKALRTMLDWWTKPQEYGEKYLSALQQYHQNFFDEEERRIAPVLKKALAHAQALSKTMLVQDLLVELTRGLHFESSYNERDLILIPVYWSTPLVFMGIAESDVLMLMYGARPPGDSLVPGEQVPEDMLRALKALADPTRLKIMRYLAAEPLTPAELARRLRLRPPTVVHHLWELRLAGLVHIDIGENDEKRYAPRLEAIDSTFDIFQDFLQSKNEENEQT